MSFRTAAPATFRSIVAAFLALVLASPAGAQQLDSRPPFRIVTLEGEGAINNLRSGMNRGITVLVEDENKNPLSGVAVTFTLPAEGPSGLFPDGSRALTVFTDDKGLAASRRISFNNGVGLMRVNVSASLFSQTASAIITQTNVGSAQSAQSTFVPSAGSPRLAKPVVNKKVWVWVAVAAAAGVGGFFAYRTLRTQPATISPGIPTVGTPR
ncbi:MAG: hypothetical protein SFV18_00575 [Bryobacteraceae bacterium]|nr:hypothetical protein [Bryobacteraceae bacterium]